MNDKAEEYVKLTSLYLFAKNVRSLLHTYHYQQIFLHEFSMAYTKYVGETLQPKTYGYSSVEELLGAIPQVGVFLMVRDVRCSQIRWMMLVFLSGFSKPLFLCAR